MLLKVGLGSWQAGHLLLLLKEGWDMGGGTPNPLWTWHRKELIIVSSREMVEASWWQGPISENLDSVFLWLGVGRALPGL